MIGLGMLRSGHGFVPSRRRATYDASESDGSLVKLVVNANWGSLHPRSAILPSRTPWRAPSTCPEDRRGQPRAGRPRPPGKVFYNEQRRQFAIGYLSVAEVERAARVVKSAA